MAPGRAGRCHRPIRRVPQGIADVAATHCCLSRRVPPGQARQRHAHRSPATTHQQVHGRRGRSIDPVWANRRLLLRAGNTLSDRARDRLSTVFTTDDATGKLRTAWLVKEQLRALLATGSLADAAAAKDRLHALVVQAAQPETNRLCGRSAGRGRRSKCSLSRVPQPRKWKPTTPR
ncbi:transposase [Pseudarthrobacter sp. L1SW]|uniref:transposase n=1 Tax=Pseudarthrobacter sp. L1SW TaxID=2851598 RepID=UPI0021067ECF|nr:transposase [Pseudarthrobacter sp. L1SW]